MSTTIRAIILFLLLILPTTLIPSRLAQGAATINVANGAVDIANDGICSLLEAIDNAQNSSTGNDHSDCTAGDPAGEDIIELANNGNYMFGVNSAEIFINNELSIIGNGATLDHHTAGFFDLNGLGHLRMRNVTVTGSDGDVAAITGVGKLTLRNCTFSENVNTDQGGAIDLNLNETGVVDIDDCDFENNVSNSNGGAAYFSVKSTTPADVIRITNSRFEGNGQWIGAPTTTTIHGGAIYIEELFGAVNDTNEVLHIDNTKFFNNYAIRNGGAISVEGVIASIANSGFDENEANIGGALNTTGEADVTVEYSVISNNVAGDRGGGVRNRSATIKLYNSTISGNSAEQAGGISNVAAGGDTAASVVTLDFSTVAYNTSTAVGTGFPGGIYSYHNGSGVDSILLVQNSIVYGNSNLGTSYVDCVIDGGSFTSFGYNLKANSPVSGCPFNEPTDENAIGGITDHLLMLADNLGPTRTHALTSTSTAKNKIPLGTNGCDANVLDQRGFLRSSGNGVRCDIGAYEYDADTVPTPPTAVEMREVSAETPTTTMTHIWLISILLAAATTALIVATKKLSRQ